MRYSIAVNDGDWEQETLKYFLHASTRPYIRTVKLRNRNSGHLLPIVITERSLHKLALTQTQMPGNNGTGGTTGNARRTTGQGDKRRTPGKQVGDGTWAEAIRVLDLELEPPNFKAGGLNST